MSDTSIFDSMDLPVPPVRHDLQLIRLNRQGEDFIYIHDSLGYVPENFALSAGIEPILSLINGEYSINQISEALRGRLNPEELFPFIQFLDSNCLLESATRKAIAGQTEDSFEAADTRSPALAGEVYSDKPAELNDWLDGIFSAANHEGSVLKARKALFAPHIDPAIGKEVYAKAFSTLRNLRPRRVIILGTSHYAGLYSGTYDNSPFIGTGKSDFRIPGSTIPVDKDYMKHFSRAARDIGYTDQDRAHRIEHSIELHLLFARYIWKHDFRIAPILVNSFDELCYMPDGHLAGMLRRFSSLLADLDDDDTFYLISGDLSHVGLKFGDPVPAAAMREDVVDSDTRIVEDAAGNRTEEMLKNIGEDRYRICGFPPLYTFLNAFPEIKGEVLDYRWWDESKRESAVSYGAIAY